MARTAHTTAREETCVIVFIYFFAVVIMCNNKLTYRTYVIASYSDGDVFFR